MLTKLKESYSQAIQEGDQRKRSTDFWRMVTLSYVWPHATASHSKFTAGGTVAATGTRRNSATGGVRQLAQLEGPEQTLGHAGWWRQLGGSDLRGLAGAEQAQNH